MGGNAAHAGRQLKIIRQRTGLTVRDVEALSRRIAEQRGDSRYYISNAWLAQMELRGSVVPALRKLASLSIIYNTPLERLILLYERGHQEGLPPAPSSRTNIFGDISLPSAPAAVGGSVHLASHSPDTQLAGSGPNQLMRLIEQMVSPSRGHSLAYAVVGSKDLTMVPLLRPGSLVIIDRSMRRVQKGPWRSELDRPLYLRETREGYTCSWCEEGDGHVLLIPHPQSPCKIRRFARPQDISVAGQVIAVLTAVGDLFRPASVAPAASA